MKSILLKNVLLENQDSDILIEDNKFSEIARGNSLQGNENTKIIDCKNLAILPPFYNAHTHAAMSILRGVADDLPLFDWLSKYIWPLEKKLTPEDIYIGSRLAILEMIRSGTVFFSDMYWYRTETIKAVEEMGIRATIGVTFAENLPHDPFETYFDFLKENKNKYERIQLAVMPHSVYTVGPSLFKKLGEFARAENLILHTHIAETKKEVEDCFKEHGKTPVEYLNDLGVIDSNFIGAHAIYVTEQEMEILSRKKATVAHNPASNLKLSSGIFCTEKMLEHQVDITLGTDGASSNNNLDMHEAMKLAALLAKQNNPEILNAKEALNIATRCGAKAYGIHAGHIQKGMLADALLIERNNERLIPDYNLISNWVYAADSRAIHSVICNGKFVMENKVVLHETEIIESAKELAKKIRRDFKI